MCSVLGGGRPRRNPSRVQLNALPRPRPLLTSGHRTWSDSRCIRWLQVEDPRRTKFAPIPHLPTPGSAHPGNWFRRGGALLVASAPSRFPQQIPNYRDRRLRRLLTFVLQCTPHSPGALCLERILQPSGSRRRPAASPDPESTRAAELGGSGWFSEGQADPR